MLHTFSNCILFQLIYEHALPTHTSLQLNSIFLPSTTSQKKALEVVDVPGHPRLRGSFKTYVPEAKAIVFVVDASTVTRRGAQVAECVMISALKRDTSDLIN